MFYTLNLELIKISSYLSVNLIKRFLYLSFNLSIKLFLHCNEYISAMININGNEVLYKNIIDSVD